MPMELFAPQLREYLDGLVPPRPPELQKMEAYAQEQRFPILGPACGYVCYQLARMVSARRIYELGSGFGYSTAWFAQAVQENGGGEVHHVVWDEKLSQQARVHLNALGYSEIVHYTLGEAVGSLNETQGEFDIIFCDIDKEGYPDAIRASEGRLRRGGLLIVDNMLWGGQIFDENDQTAATQAIRECTGMLASSDRWLTSIVPIRDGLLVAMRV